MDLDTTQPRWAHFSPCRTWRYALGRQVATKGLLVLVCGQNGSVADEHRNDTTITKCCTFAAQLGGARLVMVNAAGFVATDPADLVAAVDPIGPENDRVVAEWAARADLRIAAWGGFFEGRLPPALRGRDRAVLAILRRFGPVHCLGRTKGGAPRHPSRLAYATPLELFAEMEGAV